MAPAHLRYLLQYLKSTAEKIDHVIFAKIFSTTFEKFLQNLAENHSCPTACGTTMVFCEVLGHRAGRDQKYLLPGESFGNTGFVDISSGPISSGIVYLDVNKNHDA